MRRNFGRLAITTLALAPLGLPEARGATIAVRDESQIAGASFADLMRGEGVAPLTIGALTITPESSSTSSGRPFSYEGQAVGTPAAPGDGNGYGTYDTPTDGPAAPLVLDFSTPLAAFGATFIHVHYWSPDPARLSVFDGPGGTGNLLGTATTSGSPDGSFVDQFVGLWSASRDIRSAVLVGDGPSHGFAIDGYAASAVPVPEPSALAVLGVAMASLVLGRRGR